MDPHFASRSICIFLTLGLAPALTAQFDASAVIQYTAEEVPLGFTPYAMNNRGWIVGSRGAVPDTPMRYRPGVGTEQISNYVGRLTDINDAGTAVGYLYLPDHHHEGLDYYHAAIIRPAGAPWKGLGTLGGIHSQAHAINEAGQVVGYASIAGNPGDYPFIYTEAEGMKMLFNWPAHPRGINESGQVTGVLRSGARPGFLWDSVEGLIDITRSDGLARSFTAVGIADNGTVVGDNYLRDSMRDSLATFSLAGGFRIAGQRRNIRPQAVNDRGWIVGSVFFDSDSPRAFLYVYGQGVRNLNLLLTAPLDRPLDDAIDINDRDEILARTRPSAAFPTRYYILKRVR